MTEITIASEAFEIALPNGLKIVGRVKAAKTGNQKPSIVVAHGFRGTQNWGFWPDVTDRLARAGYYVASFNFSRIAAQENGEDAETVAQASTISQELIDIGEVVGHLKAKRLPLHKEADTDKIALLGHSRAGGSGIIYAAEHPELVQGIIVWNGGASPVKASTEPDLSPLQAAIALDREANEERFDTAGKFVGLGQPALIVQGDSDSERLLAFVDQLKELAPQQTYVSIPGANHTFGVAHPYEGATEQLNAAVEETIAFLNRHFVATSESLSSLER